MQCLAYVECFKVGYSENNFKTEVKFKKKIFHRWKLNFLNINPLTFQIYMGYLKSVRSKWLDNGQVLFCFCVFGLWANGVQVHKLAKKERGQYRAISTEQAWSIKDLLYDFQGNFSYGTVIPSGKDSAILPARVANHSAGFGSSCPRQNKSNNY